MRVSWRMGKKGLARLALVFGLIVASIVVLTRGGMRPGVDVVGGLRFVYEVDSDGALADYYKSLASLVEDHLRHDLRDPRIAVTAQPKAIVVDLGHPVDRTPLPLPQDLGLVESGRKGNTATFALDDAEANAVIERSTRNALDRLRARADGHDAHVVEREGNRIVIELPGLKTSEAARIRSILDRP